MPELEFKDVFIENDVFTLTKSRFNYQWVGKITCFCYPNDDVIDDLET